jgi:hypothetical protein
MKIGMNWPLRFDIVSIYSLRSCPLSKIPRRKVLGRASKDLGGNRIHNGSQAKPQTSRWGHNHDREGGRGLGLPIYTFEDSRITPSLQRPGRPRRLKVLPYQIKSTSKMSTTPEQRLGMRFLVSAYALHRMNSSVPAPPAPAEAVAQPEIVDTDPKFANL